MFFPFDEVFQRIDIMTLECLNNIANLSLITYRELFEFITDLTITSANIDEYLTAVFAALC